MGSRQGGGGHGYHQWNIVSGVPGLGCHIRPTKPQPHIYQDWTLEPPPNLRHQSSISSSTSTHSSSEYQCSSQVVSHCYNCGTAEYRTHASDYYTIASDSSISSADANQCPILPKKDFSFHKNSHKQLSRSDIGKIQVKIPKVTFAEFSEKHQGINVNHQKLKRKDNVSQIVCEDYKCVKSTHTAEDDYAYAYSDFISPATIIKLEQSNASEYSEDTNIYAVIEDPVNKKTSKACSDCSDQDSFYLSISRGRRKQLKLNRFVGWDFGTMIGVPDDFGTQNADDFGSRIVGIDERGDGHSRLLKILSQVSLGS